MNDVNPLRRQTLDAWSRRLSGPLLLASMAGLLGLVGWIFAGGTGLILASMILAGLYFVAARLPLAAQLRSTDLQPLEPHMAPGLFWALDLLCRKAQVARPRLYLQNSILPNAYTLGQNQEALILTRGLLEQLEPAEIRAVLAHEVAHLKNRDLGFLMLAQLMGRITAFLAVWGQWLALLSLPLFLAGQAPVPWLGLAVLILAPRVYLLLLMAFSRSREFLADQVAVELTGEPGILAQALLKIQRHIERWRPWSLFRAEPPPLYRSHPALDQRIRRLKEAQAALPGGHSPWLD